MVMYANLFLKQTLLDFWKKFGGRKTKGVGFSPELKLSALIELSLLKIPFHKQQPISKRRLDFDGTRTTLHPFRRFGKCFVCESPATDRHHIVQLQKGCINSKKNLVSLCSICHSKIHPWLSQTQIERT